MTHVLSAVLGYALAVLVHDRLMRRRMREEHKRFARTSAYELVSSACDVVADALDASESLSEAALRIRVAIAPPVDDTLH